MGQYFTIFAVGIINVKLKCYGDLVALQEKLVGVGAAQGVRNHSNGVSNLASVLPQQPRKSGQNRESDLGPEAEHNHITAPVEHRCRESQDELIVALVSYLVIYRMCQQIDPF